MAEITRRNYSTRSPFEEMVGYSRAVRVGDMVFVAGTMGLNYETGIVPEDPAEQMEQIARNITLALEGAGATMADVVQTTVYVTSPEVFEAIVPVLKRVFGDARPTNTSLVSAFPSPEFNVEVQVNAVVGSGKNVELIALR